MNKELLFSITAKDFDISYFSGTGPGGQNRNKSMKCVRITHIASGAIGTGQEERSAEQNKKNAFKRCINSPKFKNWHKLEVARHIGLLNDVDKKVDEEMKKIKIEVFEEGKWKTE